MKSGGLVKEVYMSETKNLDEKESTIDKNMEEILAVGKGFNILLR